MFCAYFIGFVEWISRCLNGHEKSKLRDDVKNGLFNNIDHISFTTHPPPLKDDIVNDSYWKLLRAPVLTADSCW